MVEENKIGGVWYQIARYGVHNDFLQSPSLNVWNLEYKADGFFSLSVNINGTVYTGYIRTDVSDNSLSVVLNLQGSVFALNKYFIIYFDLYNYMFLGNSTDMFIFSKRNTIDEREKDVIMSLSKQKGYEPQYLMVGVAYSPYLVSGQNNIIVNTTSIGVSRPEEKPSTVIPVETINTLKTPHMTPKRY